MKRLLLLVLTVLTGCGGQGTHPNIVQRAQGIHNPRVVIVGDSTMTAWLTPAVLAANPLWTAQTSPLDVQETSTQLLARLPLAIGLHPDVIVLEAGVWDLVQPQVNGGYLLCTAESFPDQVICNNVITMVHDIQQAGIYCIIVTVPPWGVGPLANTESIDTQLQEDNILTFNKWIISTYSDNAYVSILDFHTLLAGPPIPGVVNLVYVAAYTDDGVNPNAAGGQVMTQAATTQIAATKRGGAL